MFVLRWRFVGGFAISVLVLALDAVTPRGLTIWPLQFFLVWIAGSWSTRRELGVLALACALFVFLGFWVSPGSNLPVWIGLCNRAFGAVAILVLLLLQFKREAAEAARQKSMADLEESIAKMNILSGLLPLCASCKKIRNEDGQWEQLETYIRRRSGAEFTHGLCQECINRLYPGFRSPQHTD